MSSAASAGSPGSPHRSGASEAGTRRCTGSGSGLEFAASGWRQLDGMISQHAELAGSLAAEIGLPVDVQAAIGASYERWDGRGWPGELRAAAIPVAARLAQVAEYIEVAHRIGGEQAAVDAGPQAPWLAVRSGSRRPDRRRPEGILGKLETARRGMP